MAWSVNRSSDFLVFTDIIVARRAGVSIKTNIQRDAHGMEDIDAFFGDEEEEEKPAHGENSVGPILHSPSPSRSRVSAEFYGTIDSTRPTDVSKRSRCKFNVITLQKYVLFLTDCLICF